MLGIVFGTRHQIKQDVIIMILNILIRIKVIIVTYLIKVILLHVNRMQQLIVQFVSRKTVDCELGITLFTDGTDAELLFRNLTGGAFS